jgi:hypothetical protein
MINYFKCLLLSSFFINVYIVAKDDNLLTWRYCTRYFECMSS